MNNNNVTKEGIEISFMPSINASNIISNKSINDNISNISSSISCLCNLFPKKIIRQKSFQHH